MRKYHLPPQRWRLKRSVVSRYVQHSPPRLRRIERRTERRPDGSDETVPRSSRGALRREKTLPSASAEEKVAVGAVVSGGVSEPTTTPGGSFEPQLPSAPLVTHVTAAVRTCPGLL